jgi:thiol-disulfide isomerase/thioredoxin
MTRPIASLLLAALAICGVATLTAADIPRQAPELTIYMQGRPVQLSQYKGYICAVAFMSTTCPHCQHLATVLAPIQQEYAVKGVQVLGVVFNPEANIDLPAFTRTFAKGMFPIGMSTEELAASFVQHPPGIHYIPMMVFIDKHGVIRAQHLGIDDGAFFADAVEVQNIRNELDKIIKEPTIALPAAKKK